MAFENFPRAAREQKIAPPRPNWLGLVAGILFIGLMGAAGYIIWERNQHAHIMRQPLIPMETARSAQQDALKKELIEASVRYDMLKLMDAQKDSLMQANDSGITEKKRRIDSLLSKVNATQSELAEARRLIASLKSSIEGYKVQVAALINDTTRLVEEKQVVAKQQLGVQAKLDSAKALIKQQEDIIDVGTTLNAINFSILSIDQRQNGKERETFMAKRVDKLRITFEVGENRIAPSGVKEIYVCLTGPDGSAIAVEAFGSGRFLTRDGAEKMFTEKIDINYIQGQRQIVSFDWKQNTDFEPGDYKIEVFNNGFKIGQGVRHLKKK